MSKVQKLKIGVVSGSRAEYGYLRPLLTELKNDQKINLRLYAAGMHLVKKYGNTIQEIIKDGFDITRKVDMEIKDKNSPYDLAVSIAAGVKGFATTFKNDKPDILVVFGDRIEPFAAAVAATALNLPIVHISGGEVALGDIDNNLRHAITKLAHLHFASTKKNWERILRLGEEKWRVFRVGALTADTISPKKLLSKKEIFKKYNITNESIILVSYQPITTEWQELGRQMRLIMEAVLGIAGKERGIVVIYPNNYPGGEHIIEATKEYLKKFKCIYVFRNLPHLDFLSLMASSAALVGNSSSGIIEAPFFGIPYVCVGTRQLGREKAKNVIDVACNKQEIAAAIKKALFDKDFLNLVKKCQNPYGGGKASQKILRILKNIKIDKRLLQKKMTY